MQIISKVIAYFSLFVILKFKYFFQLTELNRHIIVGAKGVIDYNNLKSNKEKIDDTKN